MRRRAAKRVSADGTDASAPRWLDDGRLRFAYAADSAMVYDRSDARVGEPATGRRAQVARRAGWSRRRWWRRRGGMTSPDGKWTAFVRDTPPPKREKVYESEFAKRHEERFKGVTFDWMDFQRDGAQFPLPNARIPTSIRRRKSSSRRRAAPNARCTRSGLRPAGANWNQDGHDARVHRRLDLSQRAALRPQRHLDGVDRRHAQAADVEQRLLVRERDVLARRQLDSSRRVRRRPTP